MLARIVLAGHGEPVLDHVQLVDERARMTARRADKIAQMLAERPLTAHELALRMWGNIAVTQAFLTLSEVLGHIDLLLLDGRVNELVEDGVARFEATDGGRAPA